MRKYSLSKNERIKSKLILSELFSANNFFISGNKTVKLLYLLTSEIGQEEKSNSIGKIKFAVTVSKKVGNAVWRNRIKRLIKESYRLFKPEFYALINLKGKNLYIIITPFHLNQKKFQKVSLCDVNEGIKEVLLKTIKKINSEE